MTGATNFNSFQTGSSTSTPKQRPKKSKKGWSSAKDYPKDSVDKNYVQNLLERKTSITDVVQKIKTASQKQPPTFLGGEAQTEADKLLQDLVAMINQLKNDTPTTESKYHQYTYSTKNNPWQLQSNNPQMFYETFSGLKKPDQTVDSYKLDYDDENPRDITATELESSEEYQEYKKVFDYVSKIINKDVLKMADPSKKLNDYANLDELRKNYVSL